MTAFPDSPQLLRGGIVLVDPTSGVVLRVISLQYNPDTLTRTLQAQGVGADSGDRSEALRLKGPAIETLKLEAEIDATDQLETASPNDDVVRFGLLPQLSVLELLVYPTTAQLVANDALANAGILEILPMEQPLTLFVWSTNRIVPVRLTEFTIAEEAFDTKLNPIRAKVTLGLRVLSVSDLGFQHRGGSIYLAYQRAKERFAATVAPGRLGDLGIGALP